MATATDAPAPSSTRPVAVIAIDAGTTSVRALAFDAAGRIVAIAQRPLTQHFPAAGWVEHDAAEIWTLCDACLGEVTAQLAASNHAVASIGITNQRETAVAWDRATGRPLGPAIVWQDRRTAGRCDDLAAAGSLAMVRERTGLVLDPYFSATKWAWLLAEGGVANGPDLALGTVDAWILWNLTGGAGDRAAGVTRGVLATDVSNASRTSLLDIRTAAWDEELCELFGVPIAALAQVRPSSGRFGVVAAGRAVAAGTPVSGIAGDQQAALFGQACFAPGQTKNTYGTGSFLLANVGTVCPGEAEGLLTTIAWQLGDGPVTYALEGSIFVTGAAVQWLRDGLGIIDEAAGVTALASSVADAGGCVVVPAFTGLGSPWWDPYARGAIFGLTRGVGRAHIARAVLESMAFQTRDVVEAMAVAAGLNLDVLRVDGGAAASQLLLSLQADQLGVPVARAATPEATALGAAWLAGLAESVWPDLDALAAMWSSDAAVVPSQDRAAADASHQRWLSAVARSRRLAAATPPVPRPSITPERAAP